MQIAYDRAGSGPAVVLLHPLGADRRIWDPVVDRLTATREVIAMDLPGFGQSPPLTGVVPTPRALADGVSALCGRLGLERPHVAGNSLGGWVALELGLDGTARSVAAVAPAGLWANLPARMAPHAHHLARWLGPLAEPAMATATGRRLLLRGSMAHPERMPASAAAHLIASYGHAPGFVAVNAAMRAGRFASLERVRCPVTLVWPEHDRLVTRPAWLPERVQSITLTDAGHVPMWDAPQELAQLLLAASAPSARETA